MTKASIAPNSPNLPDVQRRKRLGEYFRMHREADGRSVDQVAVELELSSADILVGYESGQLSIPLEDVFALTNLLNISPEDVMDLVHTLYLHGDS